MSLEAYLPVLVQVLLATSIAGAILLASHFLGQRAFGNYASDAPYECGLIAEGKAHPRFAVKFHIVAMLFILFDVEVVFLLPWVLIFREFLAAGIPILAPGLFFIAILTVGLVYEIKKKGLEWER